MGEGSMFQGLQLRLHRGTELQPEFTYMWIGSANSLTEQP